MGFYTESANMIEEIEERPQLNYRENKALFEAIAITIKRQNNVFSIHDFYSLARLHNMDLNVVSRLYNGFVRENLKQNKIRKFDSAFNEDSYELI